MRALRLLPALPLLVTISLTTGAAADFALVRDALGVLAFSTLSGASSWAAAYFKRNHPK